MKLQNSKTLRKRSILSKMLPIRANNIKSLFMKIICFYVLPIAIVGLRLIPAWQWIKTAVLAAFAESMNSLNIKKVTATTKMFNSLARLAEADGEDAMSRMADALFRAVKELSQAVNELEGVMGDMPEKQGGAISGAFEKLRGAVTGQTEEVKKLKPPAGAGEINLSPVVNAIRALQERFDSAIPIKEEKGWFG